MSVRPIFFVPFVAITVAAGCTILDGLVVLESLTPVVTSPGANDTPISTIDFDPIDSDYLDLVQASDLALTDAELAILQANGLVFTSDEFLTFGHGYDAVYVADLPVYISADAILFSLHRSYDAILKGIEVETLIPELRSVLTEMREALADGALDALDPETAADADLYLAVALSLLNGSEVALVAGGDSSLFELLTTSAEAAEGMQNVELFGVLRPMDFSQFEPRGHYTDTIELQHYFRAMIWLGRVDLRLTETISATERVFNRRQLDLAAGLAMLMDDVTMDRYATISNIIQVFVGASDNMTPPEMNDLFEDLGISSTEELVSVADATIESALDLGGYGHQRIASHITMSVPHFETFPLSSTFLLFGQAYVVDSHAFSDLVYDRLITPTPRLMPNPLDVAFTVLGNEQALDLLASEIETYQYESELLAVRQAVVDQPAAFWEESLYNFWLQSLATLSTQPSSELTPTVFTTEAWGRRLLNTQLASWAELRHDTILYAKQSYTGGITCEFPDAYVDPYPEFFRAVADYANAGNEVVADLGLSDLDTYFTRLGEVANTLAQMAENQLAGLPLSAEHLAFANEMVRIQPPGICGSSEELNGWYGELFVDGSDPTEFDPTIADVHTQPTDIDGNVVGRVLHVGTGRPRLMAVAVDTPFGDRTYTGVVSSYYEVITEDFQRLTDEEWAWDWLGRTDQVEWINDLIAQ